MIIEIDDDALVDLLLRRVAQPVATDPIPDDDLPDDEPAAGDPDDRLLPEERVIIRRALRAWRTGRPEPEFSEIERVEEKIQQINRRR